MLAGLAIRPHLSLGTSEDLVALGSAGKRWVTKSCAGMTQKELILLETEASMKELLKVLPRVMIVSVVGNRMGKVSPIPNELLSYLWE